MIPALYALGFSRLVPSVVNREVLSIKTEIVAIGVYVQPYTRFHGSPTKIDVDVKAHGVKCSGKTSESVIGFIDASRPKVTRSTVANNQQECMYGCSYTCHSA
jgi:hypothetical protein